MIDTKKDIKKLLTINQVIKRIIKSLKKLTLGKVLLYIFMTLLVAFTSLPLIYVIVTAFKPIDELFIFPPRFFVKRPTTRNFNELVMALDGSIVPFSRYVFNSVFVTITIVLCTVIVSSMGAYSVVKLKPKGCNIIFTITIAALMFSPHVTQIPTFIVVKNLKMIDTYWALIIPKIAVAYNFFLIKQFTEQFPDALLESARLEGAVEWQIYWKVLMPSLKPAWSTLVVLSFVSNWNDYFSSLIFTSNQEMKTLPLALQTIAGGPANASIGRAGAVAAVSFLMIVPTIIIFTYMQSKVIETMTYSGIKG